MSQSRRFTSDELALFLADTRLYSRDFAIYVLALRMGLAAETISALDVRHVSPDGLWAPASIDIPRARSRPGTPKRRRLIPGDVRAELTRYLAWRRRWLDFRRPVSTYVDGAGIERCEACQSESGFMNWPLFADWRGRRLSAKCIRQGFGLTRDRLGLDRELRFDSLRATGSKTPGKECLESST